jgi:hypothetical protein
MRYLLIIILALVLGVPDASAQDAPLLEIPVPGIELTPIIKDNEAVTVPWLAQYISGAYTFLISIAGLLATVMMVIGGFQYVTSAGDKGKIGAAKTRIVNALTGLVLALGSYVVLFSINPDLVTFQGLRIAFVQTDPFDQALGTTMADTVQGTAPPQAGTYVPTSGACPFQLLEKQGTRAGRLEFYTKVQSGGYNTGATAAERVMRVAEIADVCNVHLGSCGRTAGAINALAGVGGTECLLEKFPGNHDRNNCNDHSKGRELFRVKGEQRLFMYALRCDTEGAAQWQQCSFSGPWPKSNSKCVRQDCVASGVAARNRFRDYMFQQAAAGTGGIPKDWPDAWANQLLPGDRLVIYNGNNDLVGAHAIIFMGWAKDGKSAQVVQGSAGQPTKGGTWCIKKACGDRLYPLTNAWRP